MATTYWTLEYNGQEKTLAAWGFEEGSVEATFSNMATDVFTVLAAGARIEDDPIFPFEAKVIVRRGRTLTGEVFGGGAIEFQGKRLQHMLDGQPTFEGVIYQFGGPWYDIDQTPYQQSYKSYTGDPNNLATLLSSDVVLFQRVIGPGMSEARNTGQQITDTLQHLLDQYQAQAMAAPFQIGTIEPAVALPTYPATDIKCGEVIQHCLRCSPNAKVWFDYSVVPPRLHVTSRNNLTPATIAIGDGVKHESIRLTPRHDLQLRGVVIYFKRAFADGGDAWIETVQQKAPANCPEGGLRVLVQTINLQGYTRTYATGELACTAVTNTRSWWKRYVPELQSTKVRKFAVGAMTVKDQDTNEDVSLVTYPNVLEDGSSVAEWMQLNGGAKVTAKKVVIKAVAQYDLYDVDATGGDPENATNGRLRRGYKSKELSARVTVTNGVTGPYSSVESETAAEEIPANMAQSIWNALADLQYEGTVSIVEPEISGGIGMGNALNLSGGRPEWATMNALIQTIQKSYGVGRTTITVGPARHLSAADLTQLFLISRNRRSWVNPLTLATAKTGSGGRLALGKNAPKENTNSGLPDMNLLVMAEDAGGGNKTEVHQDAKNKQIIIQVVNGTGTRVDSEGWIKLALAALAGKGMEVREWDVCVPDGAGGTIQKKAKFLSTEAY